MFYLSNRKVTKTVSNFYFYYFNCVWIWTFTYHTSTAVRGQPLVLVSTFYLTQGKVFSLFFCYVGQTSWPVSSWEFPVSASQLSVEMLGLDTRALCSAFTRVQTQVLTLAQKALLSLSHLPSPYITIFNGMSFYNYILSTKLNCHQFHTMKYVKQLFPFKNSGLWGTMIDTLKYCAFHFYISCQTNKYVLLISFL